MDVDRGAIERYRLALFGRMIMGVAHEIDNHLSVVLGFAELLQLTAGNEKKVQDGAGKIMSAGDRINRIVKQFSQYVRPHEPFAEPFAPAEILPEIFVFTKYDLGRGNVTVSFPPSVPAGLIGGDRRDIALALMCLLFNGSEAMAPNGGNLTLEVVRADPDWIFRVLDQGPGVTGDAVGRAFEEGFTTRDGVVHTGMGLPVARAIAASAGGDVTIENVPGGGCRATLRVPVR
jgi:signal transduction histidine kinase